MSSAEPSAADGSRPRAAAERPSADGGWDGVPGWLTSLARSTADMVVPSPMRPPPGGGRPSAVLILFGEGPDGPDVLLVQHTPWLRRHAGQPAFPGGAIDESDGGPVAAALREAAEEARVDPSGVQVLTVLPELFIARSGFSVIPVLAWWRHPVPVEPGDPQEISAVARIPISDLADPAHRLTVRYPSGMGGPAFQVGDMLVWGFTGMLVDRLLAIGGWERPWDAETAHDLPPDVLQAATRGRDPSP